MAIAVVYRPPVMTAEDYKASWEGGAPVAVPPGLIFHAGVGEGADFATISVWDSREAYDAFAPVFSQALRAKGVHVGSPQILPVHHLMMTAGGSVE
jgi:hypothetical protein